MADETELDEREKALALLAATHQFPVAYELSVITMSSSEVFEAIKAAAADGLSEPLPPDAHQMVPSKAGKYTSHRLRVPCATPEAVLELYARLRAVAGVVTLM
jgi:putative lipoic acid-binding regulatory protein